MDKTIYKIRGNVFFKLGIYILVAVLAYGTLYTGGLVLQGSYLGVYSDDDQGATPYERLVNDYVEYGHRGANHRVLWKLVCSRKLKI